MLVGLVVGVVVLCSTRSTAVAQQLGPFPHGTKNVLLNVGSNLQPILPPPDDPTTIAVAFEPIVGCMITPSPRLFVVHAAVAANNTLSSMRVLNHDGVSSSMSEPAYDSVNTGLQKKAMLRTGPRMGGAGGARMHLVPVLSMESVIQSFLHSPGT